MANGDLIDTVKAKSIARSASGYKLLDGQAATTNGRGLTPDYFLLAL